MNCIDSVVVTSLETFKHLWVSYFTKISSLRTALIKLFLKHLLRAVLYIETAEISRTPQLRCSCFVH
jgi:hypothetical protein